MQAAEIKSGFGRPVASRRQEGCLLSQPGLGVIKCNHEGAVGA